MTPPVKRGTFRRSCRSCPWTGTYSTKGLADHAKRQHKCEKYIAAARRAERHATWLATIDRTPKPCQHKYADHQHGTYACYTLDECRCGPCCEAQSDYESDRIRQQAYGRWNNMVDAEPVRAHVRALMDAGMGLKRITQAAGVSNGSGTKLIYGHYAPGAGGRNGKGELLRGPAKRVRKETADKLLAVELDLADGAKIDATDTARRIQALIACGWSGTQIATRLGLQRSNFTPLMHGRQRDVLVSTAKAVHQLYLELADTPPPEDEWHQKSAAVRSRNMARRNGWPPPLRIGGRLHVGTALPQPRTNTVAEVEELPCEPRSLDEAAIQRRLDGDRTTRLRGGETAEVVRRALAQGMTTHQIRHQLGIKAERYGSATELRHNPNNPPGETA